MDKIKKEKLIKVVNRFIMDKIERDLLEIERDEIKEKILVLKNKLRHGDNSDPNEEQRILVQMAKLGQKIFRIDLDLDGLS